MTRLCPFGSGTTTSACNRLPSAVTCDCCVRYCSPFTSPDFSRMDSRIISPQAPRICASPRSAVARFPASVRTLALSSLSRAICSASRARPVTLSVCAACNPCWNSLSFSRSGASVASICARFWRAKVSPWRSRVSSASCLNRSASCSRSSRICAACSRSCSSVARRPAASAVRALLSCRSASSAVASWRVLRRQIGNDPGTLGGERRFLGLRCPQRRQFGQRRAQSPGRAEQQRHQHRDRDGGQHRHRRRPESLHQPASSPSGTIRTVGRRHGVCRGRGAAGGVVAALAPEQQWDGLIK